MKQKTALQEFLEQIILKQVNGSIYLLPAITDIQINEALEKEKQQIISSNIFDKNGIEIKIGHTLVFPYVTPSGELSDDVDFKAEVKFKYGCFGFETQTSFIPLMEWMDIERGDYVSNCGNKKIYTEKYPFWVQL